MTNSSMYLSEMTRRVFLYKADATEGISHDVDSDVSIYSPLNSTIYLTKANRVLILSIAAILGSMMNVFFVSSFVIEDRLRRLGNVFMACTGICDIVVTLGVLPLSNILVFSNDWGSLISCKIIQVAVQASNYCYNAFFALMSVETYFRFNPYRAAHRWFLSTRFDVITILIFLGGTILSAAGFYFELDVDYCGREHTGNLMFRLITSIIVLVVPGLIAFICSLTSMFMVLHIALLNPKYRRSHQFRHDKITTLLNFLGYIIFVFSWLPYLIVVYKYPNADNDTFYGFSYIGLFRTVVPGIMYGIIHPLFRNVFGLIFYYCFYRNELKSPIINRRRRLLMTRNRLSGAVRQEAVPGDRDPRCTCETENL